MIARANDVIDHYLNGPGSYFDSGTRKPLTGEPGDDSTIQDLNNFKGSVIASMQFADDPNSIMRSVVDLIDRAKEQVEKTAQNNEGRDSIALPFPDTIDPIDDPRVTSAGALSNAALPISLFVGGKPTGAFVAPGSATSSRPLYDTRSFISPSNEPAFPDGSKDVRRLMRVSGPAAAFAGTTARPVAPPNEIPLDRPASFDDRFGDWISSPQASAPRGAYQPGPRQQGSGPLGPIDARFSCSTADLGTAEGFRCIR